MDELFFMGLGLLFLVGVIAVPILLAVAIARINRLERRVIRLERDAKPIANKPALPAPATSAVRPVPQAATPPPPARTSEDWSHESSVAPSPELPRATKPDAACADPFAKGSAEASPQKSAPQTPPTSPRPEAPSVAASPPAFTDPLPKAPARAKKPIRWEEWIGVRGAAILGGAVLALAGIFLFRHALESGWIGPRARVGIGLGFGTLCILLAQVLRKNRYGFAPSALEGGGLVALYASTWAADRLYDLIPQWASFGSMALVTALACFLALRANALLTAVIGLFGGFATPLLLSSSLDNPLQIFGYIAVLDVALLALSSKRRWPSLGLLALFGTFLVQAFWMLRHMGEAGIALGALIVGLFAVLFALSGKWIGGSEESRAQSSLQAIAILFPFLFSVFFATQFQLGDARDFYSTAGLLVLLQTAACVLAKQKDLRWLPVAASAGAMGVTGIVWLRFLDEVPRVPGWTVIGVVAALIALPLLFTEIRALRARSKSFEWTTGSAGGLLVSTVLALLFCGVSLMVANGGESDLQHLTVLSLVLAVMSYAMLRGVHASVSHALALGLGIAFAARHGVTFRALRETASFVETVPFAPFYGLILLLPALLLTVLALKERDGKPNLALWSPAAYLLPILLALPFGYFAQDELSLWWPVATVLSAGALLALLATRLRSGLLYGGSAATIWLLLTIWSVDPREHLHPTASLIALGAGALLFSLWPQLRMRGLRATSGMGLVAAGVTLPFAFSSIETLASLEVPFPVSRAALFGAALILPALGLTWLRSRDEAEGEARTALPWTLATLAGFLAYAVSDRIGIAVHSTAFALWALGLALIRRCVDRSAHVSFVAVCLTALATISLVLRLAEYHAFPRSDSFLWNEFSYAYLLPAIAGALGSVLLYRAMDRDERSSLDAKLLYAIPGLSAVLLVFLWINLTIWNAYETNEYLTLRLERIEKRDLTLSIAWAVYAMSLLGLGTALRTGALRWTSLLVLLAAIGKVFLWDLGELEGLFRVGSLAGLALCLIAVSLFYQRFVFGKRTEETFASDSESEPLLPPEGDA